MVTWKIKGIYKADPEKVYREIESLGDAFSPAEIVEAARNESSELHKCFTWDDTLAAKKYREHEARMLVASLVVKTTTTDNEPVSVRVISSTNVRNEYMPTIKLVESDTDYADLLARAISELNAFKAKYKAINELREIFEAIDKL